MGKIAFILKNIYIYIYIYIYRVALGLLCFVQAFSSYSEWGLLFVAGFSLWRLLLRWSMGSRARGLQQLQHVSSGSCGSWALE